MKLLMENWKKFLTEENLQGEYLGTGFDYSTLYRISTYTGNVESSNTPHDRDFYYTNSDGKVEHRIYFFSNENEAKGTSTSRPDDLSGRIGHVKDDDNVQPKLFLSTFKIPKDVEIFKDPEYEEDSSAVYAVMKNGKKWSLKPQSTIEVKPETLSDEDEFDDYFDDEDYFDDKDNYGDKDYYGYH